MSELNETIGAKGVTLVQARLDGQTKLLLLVYGLFACANAFSGTFVNVFLWKVRPDYALIGWFALIQQLSLGATFILGGKWVKEHNKMNCLRLGIILSGTFYMFVLFLGKQAIDWIWLLGIMMGTAMGAFWLAFNVVYFEVTDADNRDVFNGWVGLLGSGSSMVAPWLSGLLIGYFSDIGYNYIFMASIVIFSIGVVLSFWLKKRPPGCAYQWSIPLKLWMNADSPWQKTFFALAAQGLRDGSYGFLIGLLVFVATANEVKLGNYTLITSVVGLMSYYVVGRFMKWKYRSLGLLAGAIAMGIVVIPLFVKVQYITLLLFGMGMALASPLFVIPMTSTTFDLMAESNEAVGQRVELTVLRELGLFAGRSLSILTFIVIVSISNKPEVIVTYLAVIGCMPILSAWLMRRLVQRKSPSPT